MSGGLWNKIYNYFYDEHRIKLAASNIDKELYMSFEQMVISKGYNNNK